MSSSLPTNTSLVTINKDALVEQCSKVLGSENASYYIIGAIVLLLLICCVISCLFVFLGR